MSDPFKVCPKCGEVWKDRDSFLDDKTLKLNGYQADFEIPDRGLFFFTHLKEDCDSTMTLESDCFLDLYSGKRYNESQTGKKGCPKHCLNKTDLERCENMCELAFNREVINIIKKRREDQSSCVV